MRRALALLPILVLALVHVVHAQAVTTGPSPAPCYPGTGTAAPPLRSAAPAPTPEGLSLDQMKRFLASATLPDSTNPATTAIPSPAPGATPKPGCQVKAPPPTGIQQAILDAAMRFIGTGTCGLHGAPGSEACMASINQILMNAGLAPLGNCAPTGCNGIPQAVPQGLSTGRLQEITQSATVPGDLEVRHSAGDQFWTTTGDEHIAVCTTYGCTNVVSNSSSTCVFGWRSGSDMCYDGSPYCGGWSQYFRVKG